MNTPRSIDVGDPYTIAKTEYAPNGIWINAILAKAGDYKNFDYNYYFGSSMNGILPKDNDRYPNQKELDIYFKFKMTHKAGEDDSISYAQVAKNLGTTSDEIKSAVLKGLQVTYNSANTSADEESNGGMYHGTKLQKAYGKGQF